MNKEPDFATNFAAKGKGEWKGMHQKGGMEAKKSVQSTDSETVGFVKVY